MYSKIVRPKCIFYVIIEFQSILFEIVLETILLGLGL